MGKWKNPALTKPSPFTPGVGTKKESQEEELSISLEHLAFPTCSAVKIVEGEEESNKENVEVDPPFSPIRGENCEALSSLALNTPLTASTPVKKTVFPTYSFFSLVTGNEDENDGELLENNQSLNVLEDKNNSLLNTPTHDRNTSKSESNKGFSPTGSFMGHLGKENCPPTFLTPPRKSSERHRDPNPHYYESPPMMEVNFNTDASDEEYDTGKGRKYRLRPRNLFNSGVSIKPFSMYDDITSEEDADDEDDEDVFFFLQSEDEEDEYEYEEIEGEKKRSSYSGVRGPKADAKALSLVTNCPVSVKWLVNNFEYYPGRSLPRGFVYDQYVILCNENTLEPVNAASFGKLIRSVFPGLKTRRLGTRGNSKYHYNGVYLRQSSHLMAILNLIKTKQGLSYEGNGKRGRKVRRCFDAEDESNNEVFRMRDADGFVDCSPEEYLGTKPELNQPFAQLIVDEESIPNTLNINTISTFQEMYFTHCQMLLKHFEKFELRQVFDEWKRFWRLRSNEPVDGEVVRYRDIMSKATLYKVCSLKATQQFIMSMDLSTYQYVIDILFPCFSKGMPITMVKGMRNFLKDVDCFFYKIMEGYPKNMAETKLRCLRVFVLMCNDYSRSNRMLKSAISIIQNEDYIKAMHSELARSINFEEIENDVQLYKTNSETLLQDTLTLAFHSNLDYRANYTVKSWIYWAQQVANKLIQERTRQFTSEEIKSHEVNPFIIWKRTSDQILGAMVKGNAVSYGTLKSFLAWCDNLIKHITKINTSHAKGYILPVFYYNEILEELEGSGQHPASEKTSNNDKPSLRQLIYNKLTENQASTDTSAQNPTLNPVISVETLILSQEQFQAYYDGSMQYVNNIGEFVPLPPPTAEELMEEMQTIQQSSSQQFEEQETRQLSSQQLVEENREIELPYLEQFEENEHETQQHLSQHLVEEGQETPTKLL